MDVTGFLTTMAALSTAVQTLVDHLIKGRSKWLDTTTPNDPKHEGRRQSAIHLISFALGALISYTAGVYPLVALGFSGGVVDAHSKVANFLAAGLLVSFGSSFFNEALDAVRMFKKVQDGVRQAQVSAGVALPNVTS
jgi:cytochrome c biogenesis protein CcdA